MSELQDNFPKVAHNNLANTLRLLNRLEQAELHYKKALELEQALTAHD